jgi:hypothetical protein
MNPNDIATKQDLDLLHEKLNAVLCELKKRDQARHVSSGEEYLTSKQVMETYKISKSHLSDLRMEGKIQYTDGLGVYHYPKSKIEEKLKDRMHGRDT